jgi:hypothetical protein
MVVFLERFVLPFLVFVAGALLVTNPMKWTQNQRIAGALADFAVALAVGFLVASQTKKSATTAPPSGAKNINPPKRTMLPASITPEEMVSIFKDTRYNTNQATALTRGYIGQWMRYPGIVNDVREHLMFFNDPQSNRLGVVYAVFDMDLVSQISVFPPGKKVTVLGRVKSVTNDHVVLQDCEIVAD